VVDDFKKTDSTRYFSEILRISQIKCLFRPLIIQLPERSFFQRGS
jgi:hypothetical protein